MSEQQMEELEESFENIGLDELGKSFRFQICHLNYIFARLISRAMCGEELLLG